MFNIKNIKTTYPKINICWKLTHRQAIQDVDEFCFFIEIYLKKFSITCSPMDSLQWMGAVKVSPNNW